jgi:RNA polymerase sigma factor (sigma-70 family)
MQMVMLDDAQLLRRYAEEKSEQAFAELVRRHVNLVYAAALRQVGGDTHLAEDIAQSVFHDLARKAGSLSRHRMLTGWLYTSTHFAAAKVLRSEGRRRVREREASLMSDISDQSTADWDRIQPVLDAAMHELNEGDREAVLLRYFEGRALGEVGAKIGVSENAARMRVERALEKLRALLAKRGVTSTTAALAAALTAQSLSGAPASVAATITASVLATTATSLTTGTAIVKIMSLSKLQIGVISAVVVAGVTTPIMLQHQTNTRMRGENAALQQQVDELRAQIPPPVPVAIDTNQFDKERAELVRLRGEVAALRRSTQDLAQARAEISQLRTKVRSAPPAPAGENKLAEGLIPALSWSNAGVNTPAASYETLHWAKNYGQIQTMMSTFALDDAGKAKADALFATIPDSLRGQFGSPEQMMAGLLANTTAVAGMRVVDQTEQGPDDAKLRVQYQYADGRVRDDTVDFHRYADGWRQIIPEPVVDKMGRMLNEMVRVRSGGK